MNNDWELRVSWNASKYESVVPVLGWNYKVGMIHDKQDNTILTPIDVERYTISSSCVYYCESISYKVILYPRHPLRLL